MNKTLNQISRADKISFLLKSKLFDINTLTEMQEPKLNELVQAGLEATGFKFGVSK